MAYLLRAAQACAALICATARNWLRSRGMNGLGVYRRPSPSRSAPSSCRSSQCSGTPRTAGQFRLAICSSFLTCCMLVKSRLAVAAAAASCRSCGPRRVLSPCRRCLSVVLAMLVLAALALAPAAAPAAAAAAAAAACQMASTIFCVVTHY